MKTIIKTKTIIMKRRKEESFLFTTRVFLDSLFLPPSLSLCLHTQFSLFRSINDSCYNRRETLSHSLLSSFFFRPDSIYLILFGI